jgi:hypothetical protein
MSELGVLAELLEKKQLIDISIAKLIGRPAMTGHIGEYIASKIFRIHLETSATKEGIDGTFIDGTLGGKTVNIKLYGKQEGLLDITVNNLADYYLILSGPKSHQSSSRGTSRPLVISNVYLFKMQVLLEKLKRRGVRIGVATSVAAEYWIDAELYQTNRNNEMILTADQNAQLAKFSQLTTSV